MIVGLLGAGGNSPKWLLCAVAVAHPLVCSDDMRGTFLEQVFPKSFEAYPLLWPHPVLQHRRSAVARQHVREGPALGVALQHCLDRRARLRLSVDIDPEKAGAILRRDRPGPERSLAVAGFFCGRLPD